MNYYNEIDPKAAAWLRELIRAGLIPAGDVDERSIEDVRPSDLRGYVQCHFFAGIGGWSHALALAGWPSDRSVWTGSCPCQPFSAAGQGAGFADERHLWPAWQHLIAQCRPPDVFGEQVASKAADAWIDLVQSDLEGMGYAVGCVPFPAAGIGAAHIRDRSYWMGHAIGARLEGHGGHGYGSDEPGRIEAVAGGSASEAGADCRLADPDGRNPSTEREQRNGEQRQQPEDGGARGLAEPHCGELDGVTVIRGIERDGKDAGRTEGRGGIAARGETQRLADSNISAGRQGSAIDGRRHTGGDALARPGLGSDGLPDGEHPGPLHGFWADADWLLCRDGKWRPVEPGTFPLAHGLPARVVRLRGYGNAIVPQQAALFIQAAAEAIGIQLGEPLQVAA